MNKFKDYTVFLGKEEACVARPLLNGQPSNVRKVLTEDELSSLVMWYLDRGFHKTNAESFIMNDGNNRKFMVTDLIAQELRTKNSEQ